jgi:hypothetical protein
MSLVSCFFSLVSNMLPLIVTECYNIIVFLFQIHGYVSLVVCLFGLVANCLNIAVLTRREMTSPTNALLTGLAVADFLVMLEYIPFTCHMYILQSSRTSTALYSYAWATFVLFHSNFAQVIRLEILHIFFNLLETTTKC